ncbi:MAG: hypothetical protein EPO36_04920 [Chloroflexota bacterium]|nr:MAG: hypothetical protein EPO36_04920 [Chloroflexota bacterium]
MSRFGTLTQMRAFTAVLALVAIGAQLQRTFDAGALNPVNFFSYFTIQSNLIGVAVLLYLAVRAGAQRSGRVNWWRGAAAVYLTVTFFVVIFLLSHTDVGLQLPWVDVVLHKVVPVVIVADYLIDPPRTRLTISDGLLWLVYPLAWLGYTMIRGPIAGWYPYPFLDPADGGYGPVAVTVVAILIAGAVLCALYVWLANWRGAGRSPMASA